jgi:xylose isomerase
MHFSTRLNSFDLGKGLKHPHLKSKTIDLIKIAGTVRGLTALELNYPEHFAGQNFDEILSALKSNKLEVKGIQLRWPAPEFSNGGFTNVNSLTREKAIEMVEEAAEIAEKIGTDHVLLWPAHDGYEYLYQMNYIESWNLFRDALIYLTKKYPKIRFSIEYKPAEPRARTLLNSTGATLKMIEEVGSKNLGVTLDFAHLLMAHENPAQSAAMALNDGRLFGLQMNDGFGAADDGLLVGALHPYETIELAYYLLKYGYEGTYYFDTDPVREEPIKECEMNIERMKNFINIAQSLIDDNLSIGSGDGLLVTEIVGKRAFRSV